MEEKNTSSMCSCVDVCLLIGWCSVSDELLWHFDWLCLKKEVKIQYFLLDLCVLLKPLSHSHSGKYTEYVSRDLSQDGLILFHSHCL